MARVFRARLRGLGGFEKRLVIKQIRPELAKDPRFVELFVREANTLVSLSHPHIVPVYELGAADGTYYLSMEYVEGATVAQMLAQGPLAPALVAHLGAQICEALEYAHSRFGILHRDLTPRNIIVDQAGHARLVDFGIAASADAADPAAFGSPGYMSPEQVEGRRVHAQSDLFALGAVLFEALTARPAFRKTLRGSLAEPPSLDEQAPAALRDLVHALLARAPEHRPGSAAEVARSLRGFLARENPHGALEEMQRRVRGAQTEAGAERAPEPEPDAPSTARIEARAIATSPVLTEMLRSSAMAPKPQPPADASAAVEGTRRIRTSNDGAGREPRDRTDARLTSLMIRAWPLLALFALAALWLARMGADAPSKPARTPPHAAKVTTVAPAEPQASAPASLTAQAEPSPPVAPEPKRQQEASSAASVSVNAKPWAEVLVDGKAVGTTPLRKIKLRSGLHTLTLRCPPLGREAVLKLDFPAAGAARVVVDLTENPPRTFLDGVDEAR